MRRRTTVQTVLPPENLCWFDPADWAGQVPTGSAEWIGQTALDDERKQLIAFTVFGEQQALWREQHGWPVGQVDILRDRWSQQFALLSGASTARPGPNLARVLGVPGERHPADIQAGRQRASGVRT